MVSPKQRTGGREIDAAMLTSLCHAGWSTNLAHLVVDQKPSILFSMVLSALGSAPAFPEELKVILRHSDKLITHAFRVTA